MSGCWPPTDPSESIAAAWRRRCVSRAWVSVCAAISWRPCCTSRGSSIWTSRLSWGLRLTLDEVFSTFGNYPLRIFGGVSQWLLTFVLPLAFVGYLPAKVLLQRTGELSIHQLFAYLAPLVGAVCFITAYWFWMRQMRNYQSSGHLQHFCARSSSPTCELEGSPAVRQRSSPVSRIALGPGDNSHSMPASLTTREETGFASFPQVLTVPRDDGPPSARPGPGRARSAGGCLRALCSVGNDGSPGATGRGGGCTATRGWAARSLRRLPSAGDGGLRTARAAFCSPGRGSGDRAG